MYTREYEAGAAPIPASMRYSRNPLVAYAVPFSSTTPRTSAPSAGEARTAIGTAVSITAVASFEGAPSRPAPSTAVTVYVQVPSEIETSRYVVAGTAVAESRRAPRYTR